MKKMFALLAILLLSGLFIAFQPKETEQITGVPDTPSLTGEEMPEVPEIIETPASELPYFALSEGQRYKLSSEIEAFGEEVEVLKQQGNAYLAKGQYGSTLHFYRLYLIEQEGINIFFEVTEDDSEFLKIDSLVKTEEYETIFNYPSNQEFFILKSPHKVGTEWGYGKISEATPTKLVVEYENGNKTTFEKPFGITEMDYVLPQELQEHYNETSFSAIRVEG